MALDTGSHPQLPQRRRSHEKECSLVLMLTHFPVRPTHTHLFTRQWKPVKKKKKTPFPQAVHEFSWCFSSHLLSERSGWSIETHTSGTNSSPFLRLTMDRRWRYEPSRTIRRRLSITSPSRGVQRREERGVTWYTLASLDWLERLVTFAAVRQGIEGPGKASYIFTVGLILRKKARAVSHRNKRVENVYGHQISAFRAARCTLRWMWVHRDVWRHSKFGASLRQKFERN